MKKKHTKAELEKVMTGKQKNFCHEYVVDWNGSRSARVAGYSERSSKEIASELLTNVNIQLYIEFIKNDYEMLCGISKTKNLNELSKIAFSSISHLHNTWIELAEWEQIKKENPDALDAIESIDTKIEIKTYNEEDIEVKYIKVKLYSKTTALQEINKMMGYNEPERMEVKTESVEIPIPTIKTNAR